MTSTPVGFSIIAITIVVLQLIAVGWISKSFEARKAVGLLRSRLTGYAYLKASKEERENFEAEPITSRSKLMPAPEWEVLLGTLKKVEAKNSILATLLIFVLSISVGSVVTGDIRNLNSWESALLLLILALVLPALCVIRGIRQVDQLDFGQASLCERCAANKLQNALIDDLLQKEASFRFAGICTSAALPSFLVLVLLKTLDNTIMVSS